MPKCYIIMDKNESSSSVTTRDRIKCILNKSPGSLSSIQIQKIMFYADCYCVEKFGRRFSKVDYLPMMYGAYSEEIKQAIERVVQEDEIKSTKTTRDGARRKVYKYNSSEMDTPEDFNEFVDDIIEQTERMTTNELTDMSKQNYLYRKTDPKDRLSFKQYFESLKNTEASPVATDKISDDGFPIKDDDQPPEWTYPLDSME